VSQKITYDEYGNVHTNTGQDITPFFFAGGLYEEATGLTRFGARDYDARTGRWTAKDPILFAGGLSNLYEYCANDPINYIDQKGLQVEVVFWNPVGYGKSSFGHVSVHIDGQAYSFSPDGMFKELATSYIKRNTDFRGGLGLELLLNDDQKKNLEKKLKNYNDDYSRLTNNCQDPLEDFLEEIGFDLGVNILPSSLQKAIQKSYLVKKTNYYWYIPSLKGEK